jgi:uncharacterized protein (TIGR04255 family)
MSIPESARVVYRKNPLVEVICQVRYPAIFRIEQEYPTTFQDRISSDFPIAQEKNIVMQIPLEVLRALPEVVQRSLPLARAYEFSSRDGLWTVSLTRDFLALSTKQYHKWEEFRNLLRKCLNALQEVYSSPFYLRIGLRYQDIISRHALGLRDVEWAELLNPGIAGELGDPHLANDVQERFTVTLLRLPAHDAVVRMQHGLVQFAGGENDSKEICYLIDCDLFTEQQTEAQDVFHILDYLNRQAGNLFRYFISERLQSALQPEPA